MALYARPCASPEYTAIKTEAITAFSGYLGHFILRNRLGKLLLNKKQQVNGGEAADWAQSRWPLPRARRLPGRAPAGKALGELAGIRKSRPRSWAAGALRRLVCALISFGVKNDEALFWERLKDTGHASSQLSESGARPSCRALWAAPNPQH